MSAKLLDYLRLNPFAVRFASVKNTEDYVIDILKKQNSQGVSQEEIDMYNSVNGNGFYADVDISYLDWTPIFENKRQRVSKYREMSLYPEIQDALDNIVNDAIIDNGDGSIATLEFKDKKIPVGVRKRIEAAWKYYLDEVLNFSEKGDEYFRKWLVEGELYAEQISNDKGDNIIGIKILPAFTTTPIYRSGRISGYVQVPNVPLRNILDTKIKDKTPFEPNQISYANYGQSGENETDVRGFLEASVKTYNMLKSLEDSIVIYRLVRAPERRVWYINTNRMPKGKGEEYIRNLAKRYRTKVGYNADTGAIDGSQNIQSISHDYWLGVDENGNGTKIDTIGGAMNLGEITDLDYFKNKLYISLKLPSSRWNTEQKQGPYSAGKMGEVTREEIKFARFIERCQRKFKWFMLNGFETLLKMRGIPDDFCNKYDFDVKFAQSNLFKEYKELELLEARLGILSSISPFIVSRDNINQPEGMLSKEMALKKYFRMSEEDYKLNGELIVKELQNAAEIAMKYPPIVPTEPITQYPNPIPDLNAADPNQTQQTQ
jgi:hypothetical protein